MRTARATALCLMLALATAGCGQAADGGPQVASAQSGGATPTASAGAPDKPDEEAALKFAQCMRKEGITWWPDPQPGGRSTIKTPKGFDPKKLEKAQEACKEFAPNGGERPAPDPEMLEAARQMAKCMRENGVPNFPDPQPDGSIRLDTKKLGTGPGDPTFDKAEEKCQQYQPDGASQDRVEEARPA
ncbi:hypothetical protein Ade02nite_22310 [Paractinoplanes deccanensis]|uniref:Lipoprotein n=1 Tax=Paractinoplanes deccanensis TaxID=113561 RepID=A0ABQ3Y153_9ACTN|nr:hypothetical protein [Actinoplanes deccanensis]GID73590.1 hypothetical protein Ade02nite_22310 [Actinoplanes deccanensis]